MKTILFIILCSFQVLLGRAEDARIWIDATVNGNTAHFFFDTGCSDWFLFREGAERLGIAVTNLGNRIDTNTGHTGHNMKFTGFTPECSVHIRNTTLRTSFPVADGPPFKTSLGDGVIGWPSVTNSIVMIDGKAEIMLLLSHVPPDARDWLKLPVQTDASELELLIRKPNGKNSVLSIDTGLDEGIELRPDLWRNWKSSHTNQPTTLTGTYMFGPGLTVKEVAWAKEIAFGPLILTDVPVTEANSVDLLLGGEDYEATLGLAALKRLDLIVDPKNGVAYLRPKKEPPPHYNHNRLAALFLPRSIESSGSDLVAHVLKDGPGYAAGIRDGDILLKVNGQELTDLRDLERIKEIEDAKPSGTKETLTLKRGGKVFEVTVVLNDILKP